jgi:hypothetical protein
MPRLSDPSNMERWRGEVTAHLADLGRGVDKIERSVAALGDRFDSALTAHVHHQDDVTNSLDDRLHNVEIAITALVAKATVYGVVAAVVVELASRYFFR